jgi:hypothetical protein
LANSRKGTSSMKMVPSYQVGHQIEMKKPHPCIQRSVLFEVVKIGADIKIKCLGCGTILMMTRDHFNQQLKAVFTSK